MHHHPRRRPWRLLELKVAQDWVEEVAPAPIPTEVSHRPP